MNVMLCNFNWLRGFAAVSSARANTYVYGVVLQVPSLLSERSNMRAQGRGHVTRLWFEGLCRKSDPTSGFIVVNHHAFDGHAGG